MTAATATPRLSVVIATRNSERTLERCLAAVRRQTSDDLEIVVVDNASADRTAAIARASGARLYRHGPERSAQRNLGIAEAKGEYVLVLDADMYLPPEAVGECLRLLDAGCDAVVMPLTSIGIGFWAQCKALERRCYEDSSLVAAARFFRRDALLTVGGYDEELVAFEDWDLHNRCLAAGLRVAFSDRRHTLIVHDEGRLGLWSNGSKKGYYRSSYERYANLYPELSRRQLGLIPRLWIFLKNWPLLLRHPLTASAMIFMKATELLFFWLKITGKNPYEPASASHDLYGPLRAPRGRTLDDPSQGGTHA